MRCNEIYNKLSLFCRYRNFWIKKIRYCYDAYELIYHVINFWKQHRKCIILFYDVDYVEFDIIFDMFMLIKQKILINSQTTNWRFKIKINKFKIANFKKFEKKLNDYAQIFAIICANVTMTQINRSKIQISNQL